MRIFFKIQGSLMFDFNNIRGFDAFSKIEGSLMHDFVRGFGAFYPKRKRSIRLILLNNILFKSQRKYGVVTKISINNINYIMSNE